MLETYAKYGFDLNTDILKEANSQSGGHPSARFGIDLLQADSMTRMINTKEDQVIVDVGAKFASNAPLL